MSRHRVLSFVGFGYAMFRRRWSTFRQLRRGATATYPTGLTLYGVFNTDYTDINDQNANIISGATQSGTLYYYVPENQRGQTSTTRENQKSGFSNDYATYVELVGYSPLNDGKGEVRFQFYPGANMTNDYNVVRNTKYAVNPIVRGISVSDQRVSVKSLANSYMLVPGQTVYIPVKRANQTTALGTQIADVRSNVLQPYVYWQSTPGLVSAVMDNVSGCLRVTASPSATTAGIIGGNAVVGVTAGTGTPPPALWSWHIWITNYDPNLVNVTQNGYVWMDRNLGAMAACNGTNTLDQCGGLFYQWGRKDPFPGVSSTGGEPAIYYNGTATATTGLYTTADATLTGTVSPNYNLPLVILNPLTYYYGISGNKYDWYAFNIFNDNLWGLTKTVYDPCPAGWKIPSSSSSWPGAGTSWIFSISNSLFV